MSVESGARRRVAERAAPGARGPVAERVAGWLLVLGAIAYTGVPWEALVGFPLNPAEAFQSELAAADQPTRMLFAVTDGFAGAAAVVAAVLLWWAGRRRPAVPGGRGGALLERVVPVPLLLFGLGTVADVASPLPCAPSVDAGCADADGLASAGTAHSITSLVATTALILLALLLAWLLAGTRRRGTVLSPAWWVPVLAYGVTSLVSAALSTASNLGLDPAGAGWWQRAQTASAAACLVLVVPLLRRHREAGRGRAPDAASSRGPSAPVP